MQAPDTKAGKLTEEIMRIFWAETNPIGLGTPEYNRVYSHVLSVLSRDTAKVNG